MNRKCIGCGATLQSQDKNKPGYIIETLDNPKYCMRCFRIIHYNDKMPIELENINNLVLDKVNKDKALKFFLIDLLNINKETINTFNQIKGNKILLLGKMDIIPKSIKKQRIIDFLNTEYGIKDKIDFVSSKKNYNTGFIYKILEENNLEKAYVLGYTNSGKSNLINELCKKMDRDVIITTSNIPNTTLDFLDIDIEDKHIIDTPGFNLDNTFYNSAEFDLIDRINPKVVMSPLTYQLKEDTRIVIEDRLSIQSDKKNNITLYMSDRIKIDKYFKDKITGQVKEIKVPANSDIVIKGLGFINVKKESIFKITGEKLDLVEIRKSMFGDNNE